jgi:hypothetical protein
MRLNGGAEPGGEGRLELFGSDEFRFCTTVFHLGRNLIGFF